MTIQRLAAAMLCAALVVFVYSAANSQPRTADRDLFDDIYERGQKQNATLRTLTATFTESSTSSLLTTPIVARGTVAVERPSRVVMRYSEPAGRVMLIDADKLTIVWPSARMKSVSDIGAAQRRVQKYFIDSSPSELRGHFQITARDAPDRAGAYLLTMAPKRKQIQQGLTGLELWIDRASLMLSAMKMTFPNGDTKLMTFADVKVNPLLEPSVFTIDGISR